MGLRRRIATTFAATAAATGMAIGLAAPANALSEGETNEFLGKLTATYNDPTVSSDGNPYDFDIVTKAALVTGADKTLASLGSFTLFAPNDRAFEVTANNLGLLGKNYRYSAKVDETRVFNAIANSGVDVTEILLYHVIPNAKVTGKQVLSGPFTQRIDMANQEKLRVTVLSRSARFPVIVLGDKDG
ncbi:MAG: fasciclin domain-containing protein, partial [Actinobacteria bacterium]|nr:fasciclin domain-containing protein [Actinomycetota bacterium]